MKKCACSARCCSTELYDTITGRHFKNGLKFSAFDVSADLTELGRTPVTVVCAGVKSILDIGSTLEYLVIGHTGLHVAYFVWNDDQFMLR